MNNKKWKVTASMMPDTLPAAKFSLVTNNDSIILDELITLLKLENHGIDNLHIPTLTGALSNTIITEVQMNWMNQIQLF